MSGKGLLGANMETLHDYGGVFNVTNKVAKIIKLAADSEDERKACNFQLAKHGYFLDRVGIL